MKINSRYESQLNGMLNLERLFGQYHFTTNIATNQQLECLDRPLAVHLNFTDKCNLNCHYCYAHNLSNLNKELTLENQLKILDILKQQKVFMLYISGGEPSVNANISPFLKYAIECGFIVIVLSNLVDIHNYNLEILKSKQIQIQLGLNDIWNENRENYKNLLKACKNYRFLQNSGVRLCATIMIDYNPISLNNLLEFLTKNEIYKVRFGLMIREGQMRNFQFIDQYIRNSIQIMQELVNLRPLYPNLDITIQNEPTLYYDSLFSRRMAVCEAGISELYIDSNGDVYPCPLFKNYLEFKCGNILYDSMHTIWSSEPMVRFRNISLKDTKCNSCNQLCGVWCRGLVYSYTGDISSHSPFCYQSILK